MNCWHCDHELIWGGDHDTAEGDAIETNLSCPNCKAFVLVYAPIDGSEDGPDKTSLKEGRIKRIHVNQHHIRHNKKNPQDPKPVFTVKHTGGNEKGYAVHIHGPSTAVYSPDNPLSCGAHVWIQTTAAVEVFEEKEL